jgi:hypothetical protein
MPWMFHSVIDECEHRYTVKSERGELWDTKGHTVCIQDHVDIVVVSALVECVYKMNHPAICKLGNMVRTTCKNMKQDVQSALALNI